MTLDEPNETSVNASDQVTASSAEGTTAPARTPRKRATRARTTPAAAPPVADDGSGAATASATSSGDSSAAARPAPDAPDAPAEAAEAAEAPAAPAKRARAPRKRAAPRSAPRTEDSDEPTDQATDQATTEPQISGQLEISAPSAAADGELAADQAPVIPAAEITQDAAPKTPRRRRRSTSPVLDPATTADLPTADLPTADLPSAEPVSADPVTSQPFSDEPATDEPASADAVTEPGIGQPAEPDAAAAQVSAAAQEAPAEPGRASRAIVMPLFQAPEPVAPRRRRAASRPAGPPVANEPGDHAERPAAAQDAPDEPGPLVDDQAVAAAALAGFAPADDVSSALPADLDDLEDGDDEDTEDTEDVEEIEDVDGAEDSDAEEESAAGPRRRRRRGGRGRRGRGRGDAEPVADEAGELPQDSIGEPVDDAGDESADEAGDEAGEPGELEDEPESAGGSRRRRRRRRRGSSGDAEPTGDDPPNTITRVRESRDSRRDEVTGVRGSTRLEAKKQRRREGREAGRKRTVITEAEFLTRRESVDRVMVVREREGRTQIGVLEDGVLVEHYVARKTQNSMVGNVYLGRVQNVLPSMEAAFVDIGKGRNAVLYAGEVNWDAAGLDGQPRRIEHALTAGEAVLVQVTKDPIGHKGARLTSQISMPGRYLVYVPGGSMTGISRKLPDIERTRLKKILREIVPDEAGVIVRTAAEGASDEELERDVARLQAQWDDIQKKQTSVQAPALLYGEPDLAIRVVRDIFNEDIGTLVVSGADAWDTLQGYVSHVAPDLASRLQHWTSEKDVFAEYRIDEQLAKALDRKVWLPSGGSLVIDRTEAMTVVDVNTGKFTGSGGNLEETVTKNNLEAAEEVVRQLRLRDIGGIIVVDFIDMVLESNRELVTRRLLECLGRDRTRHQVAEVTSLGLVQMTRKRVGQGLLEVFSENCEHCSGRGVVIHDEPVEKKQESSGGGPSSGRRGSGRH